MSEKNDYMKSYYRKNRERLKEQARNYYTINRSKIRPKQNEYLKNRREYFNERARRQREKRKNLAENIVIGLSPEDQKIITGYGEKLTDAQRERRSLIYMRYFRNYPNPQGRARLMVAHHRCKICGARDSRTLSGQKLCLKCYDIRMQEQYAKTDSRPLIEIYSDEVARAFAAVIILKAVDDACSPRKGANRYRDEALDWLENSPDADLFSNGMSRIYAAEIRKDPMKIYKRFHCKKIRES